LSIINRKIEARKPGIAPEWFDKNRFRAALLKRINHFDKGRWEAVSMKNGLIWFRYCAVVESIVEASSGSPDVLALAVDKNAMNDLVFTVLTLCGDRSVMWNLMGNGHVSCKCNVFDRDGRIAETTYLTPINANWFGVLPSRFERTKSIRIRSFVTNIRYWSKRHE
jgi:hypothetical protein